MNCAIQLIHNKGFQWYSGKDTYVKGYCYSPGDEYLEGAALLNFFIDNFNNAVSFSDLIKNLNGVFSLIHCNEEEVHIFSDKTRFFPIFYSFNADSLNISDEPKTLINKSSKIDLISSEEFKRTGYVTGNNTLIENIKQVAAGEYVVIKDNKVARHNIFSYKVSSNEIMHYDDPGRAMHLAIDTAAKRFISSIGDHTPVLPLSGGYDSRLIACLLKEYGFDNTICFTYGRPSPEVEISKEVANRLGFKWHFIDYTKVLTGKNLLDSEEFNSYYNYASRITSMFYLQEYPATEYLRNNSLVPPNSVFLPGHSGDLLGGSQFVKVFQPNIKTSEIAKQILKSKYVLYPMNKHEKEIFIHRIQESLVYNDGSLGYSVIEDWDIKEKIAKFIFNSSQVFTHFGYQTRFLYWDNELVEFFRRLSPEHKIYKNVYDQCLKNKYFNKHNVNFEKELAVRPFQLKFQNIKEYFKVHLPKKTKQYFVKKNDWPCYRLMTQQMFQELPVEVRHILPISHYGSVNINWYLVRINKFLDQFNQN
jgi:asparagine synthase (glutamine-hydrolysing)